MNHHRLIVNHEKRMSLTLIWKNTAQNIFIVTEMTYSVVTGQRIHSNCPENVGFTESQNGVSSLPHKS